MICGRVRKEKDLLHSEMQDLRSGYAAAEDKCAMHGELFNHILLFGNSFLEVQGSLAGLERMAACGKTDVAMM